MRRVITIGLAIVAGMAALLYFFPDWSGAPAEGAYRLAKADRGEIVARVNATGTVNPITTVIVSSQLSGQVVEILTDYNSEVKENQIVARLNSDQVRAKLDAAKADLDQMKATKLVQQGTIEKVKADTDRARATQADMEAQVARNEALLADAERIFQRQQDLKTRGFVAEATHDTARATRDAQAATLNSARAQVNSAKAQIAGLAADLQVAEANLEAVVAQIAQREATVRQIDVDLRNSDIRSPVSGVVVQRNVELGQTVAASLQAPTLFLIADDLRHMEIAASIDETDVGRLKPGQQVAFTVTAYPGRTFEGKVKQVRLGAQNVQNVVIYTTIISIENPRLELLPGMTANLRVETDRRDNVVRIPNAALRWRPPSLTLESSSAATGPEQGSAETVRRGERNAGGNIAELVDTVKSEIKLEPDQVKEIDAALADLRKSFAASGEQDPASRREHARAARGDFEARIIAILGALQRGKFDEIKMRLAERGSRATQTGRVFIL
ncbi:MAG: efflux RND transporter periplasmic adaptor subunit, partial [Pseudomonadota bacterium]|nr:efflux RND transporter periplasmic adaptor subunit [Pseudomonadota bacterium]